MGVPYRSSGGKAVGGVLAVLAVIGLATPIAAQSVELRFPVQGARAAWIAESLGDAIPETTIEFTGPSFKFPLSGAGDKARLFVWDKTTGNIAQRPTKGLSGRWEVKPEEATHLAQVKVKVEHEGKPVGAASIVLADPKRKATVILDPSMQGTGTFVAVAPGPARVTVTYTSEGRTKTTPAQVFELALKRSDPVPTLSVSIPDPVSTATPVAKEEGSPKVEAPKGASTPWFANVLGYLMALAAAGGAGYLILLYVKRNPERVAQQLGKVGVKIPTSDDPLVLTAEEPDAPSPTFAKPEPPQPILLDDAKPTPLAATPAPIASVPTPVQHRLILPSGHPFVLEEGTTTVGREFASTLAFGDESSVSRRHAQLVRSAGLVTVRDLGSRNGTFVNGVKVDGDIPLRPGDFLQFGTVRCRYEV
ncbi:MAG: FHA domain-containing protein [Fimbriimonadaceae bacterium]|nr:FHA domain-containing protein [Fimbriimonadaceae bacterium]